MYDIISRVPLRVFLPVIRFYYEIKMKKISRSKQEEDKILKKL